MKRSTDNRRSPAEIGIDLQRHYGGMRSMNRILRLRSGSEGSRTKLLPKKSTKARKDERYDSKRSIRR